MSPPVATAAAAFLLLSSTAKAQAVDVATGRAASALSHFTGHVIANHAPTFTLNNNLGVPFFADRLFVEDGGQYYIEQWGCGVSDCNGGGDTIEFKFRLLNITRPNPNNPTEPFWGPTRISDFTDADLFHDGPTATEKRDGDSSIPGQGGAPNTVPQPDLCDGLPLIPCYSPGNPSSSDSGHASLTFETNPDRWGLAFYEVWVEDDGVAFPLNGVPCHCATDTDPCTGGVVPVPCNEQCNRGLAPPRAGAAAACNRQVFAVNILPVNDPPSFVDKGPVTVEEWVDTDNNPNNNPTRLVTIPNWACRIDHGGWMEWPYQDVDFRVTTPQPDFFVQQPAIARVPAGEELPCRDLTFEVAPNKCGRVEVTVVPVDNGGPLRAGAQRGESGVGAAHTFTVQVNAVNQPPSFETMFGGEAVSVPEGDGLPRTVPGWARRLKPDPDYACETGDWVAGFDVDARDTACLAFFDAQPTVDTTTGDLRFTPHAFAQGTCCYDVRAVDSHGLRGAPRELCINLAPRNDPPAFQPGGGVHVCEGQDVGLIQWATRVCAGSLNTRLACDPHEAAAQTVTFAVATDSTLFAVKPTITPQGLLTFVPAPNAAGTAVVTVRAQDNGVPPAHSADYRFSITIEEVNQPPSAVVPPGGVTVDEDSGPFLRTKFLSDVRRGPGLEDLTQVLSVGCTNNVPALFSQQPELTLNGHSHADLSFTPAPDAYGVATVTCTLSDDGGLSGSRCGGGVNSATITFPVTVLPVDDPPWLNFTETCGGPQLICTAGPKPSGCSGQTNGKCTVRDLVTEVTVLEDRGLVELRSLIVAFGGGPPNEDQTVVFQAWETGLGGPPLLDPAYPIRVDAQNGMLSFRTLPDAHGETIITVVAVDAGGNQSPQYKVKVNVQSVNDPPVAVLREATLVVDACYTAPCPLLTYARLFSSLSPGPANEQSQTLTYSVGTAQPEWFGPGEQPRFLSAASSTLAFTLKPGFFRPGAARQSLALTVRDDGGGTDTTTVSLELVVVAAEQPPSFEILAETVYGVEDAPDVTRVFAWARGITAGTPAEDAAFQGLAFACELDNPSLLKPGTTLNVDAGTGDMMFEVAVDAWGDTRASCRLTDSSGAGVVRTFPFSVLPVNDCPRVELRPGQVNVYDVGEAAYTVLTSANVGPLNEHSSQTLVLTPHSLSPGLFRAPPRFEDVSAAGLPPKLLLAPVEGAFGAAAVRVEARDTGGVARGGCDTASVASSTLTIFVVHANRPPTFELASARVQVDEDAGDAIVGSAAATTVARFVRNIDPGHHVESEQSVRCRAVFDAARSAVDAASLPSLFVAPPTLSNQVGTRHADLLFELQKDVAGVFYFDVVCTDSGPAAPPPHKAVSDPVPFAIHVAPTNDPPFFEFAVPDGAVRVWEDAGYVHRPVFLANVNAGPRDERGGVAGGGQMVEVSCQVRSGWNLFEGGEVEVVRSTRENGLGTYTASLAFRTAPDEFGTAELRCCAVDDGGNLRSGVNRFCRTGSVRVDPVNDPPTFAVPAVTRFQERPQGAAGTAPSTEEVVARFVSGAVPGPPSEWLTGQGVAQTVLGAQIHVGDSDFLAGVPQLVEAPALPGQAGWAYDLHLRLVRGRCGRATGWVEVSDSGGSTNAASDAPRAVRTGFALEVACENDAPSFRPGRTVTLCEDQGAGTGGVVLPWATKVTAGFNEPHQNVTFSVLPRDRLCEGALFARRPVVFANGSVLVEPAAERSGECSFTVSLRDGGDAFSPPAEAAASSVLTVLVRKVNDAPSFRLTAHDDAAPVVVGERCDARCTTCSGQDCATAVVVPNWCHSVSTGGGADEAREQTVRFVVVLRSVDSLDSWRFGVPANATAAFNASAFFEEVPSVDAATCALRFKPRPYVYGNFTFAAHLEDDGGRAGCIQSGAGGVDRTPEVRLAIHVAPSNNPPVVALASPTLTVLEDSGRTAFPGFVTRVGPGTLEGAREVAFLSVDTVDMHLFSAPPELVGSTLVVRTRRDANGVALLRFAVADGPVRPGEDVRERRWASETATLRVLPVNDPPAFQRAQAPVQATEGVGRVVVEGWASGMTAGPPDEAAQTLRFEVREAEGGVGFGGFFLAPPVVDAASGDLSFTLRPLVNGEVSFRVGLVDSGDATPPSVNRGVEQVASVVVVPVNQRPSFNALHAALVLPRTDRTVTRLVAGHVTAGPENEAAQSVHFVLAVVSGGDVFLEEPTLTPAGALSFTLNPFTRGQAVLSFRLVDSGVPPAASDAVNVTVTSTKPAPLKFEVVWDKGDEKTEAQRVAEIAAAVGLPSQQASRVVPASYVGAPMPNTLVFGFNDDVSDVGKSGDAWVEEIKGRRNAEELAAAFVAVVAGSSGLRAAHRITRVRRHAPHGDPSELHPSDGGTPLPETLYRVTSYDDPSSTSPLYLALGLSLGLLFLACLAAALLWWCCREKPPPPPPKEVPREKTPPREVTPPATESVVVSEPPLPPPPPPPPPPPAVAPVSVRYGTAFPSRPAGDSLLPTRHQASPLLFDSIDGSGRMLQTTDAQAGVYGQHATSPWPGTQGDSPQRVNPLQSYFGGGELG